MIIHPAIENAYRVLEGESLPYEEALALTEVEGTDILDLVSLANKVRDRFAPHFRACSIINAKSGICKENCKFCAQAACHATGIRRYPLLSAEELFAGMNAFITGGYLTTRGRSVAEDEQFRSALCQFASTCAEEY